MKAQLDHIIKNSSIAFVDWMQVKGWREYITGHWYIGHSAKKTYTTAQVYNEFLKWQKEQGI